MKNEFVPYDIALAMKELGYNESIDLVLTSYYYRNGELISTTTPYSFFFKKDEMIKAPLYQQAFRWFREKYGLWFRPDYYDETRIDFLGSIHKLGKYSAIANIEECKSAEEAELSCLKKLIEIVNQNKDE
jgi:hypothetical protein